MKREKIVEINNVFGHCFCHKEERRRPKMKRWKQDAGKMAGNEANDKKKADCEKRY